MSIGLFPRVIFGTTQYYLLARGDVIYQLTIKLLVICHIETLTAPMTEDY